MAFLDKRHEYKISSPQGVYLGLLMDVASDFTYNQTIGSSGAQLVITVEQSADNVNSANSPIYDAAGVLVIDDSNGQEVFDVGPVDIVGPSTLICNDNQVQVVEYSQYHPNGIVVFTGYISKWKTVFGNADNIIITCLSNGQDLSNYIVPGANALYADQQQLTIETTFPLSTVDTLQAMSQGFTVGVGVTNIAAVNLWAAKKGSTNCAVTVYLIEGEVPSGNPTELWATPIGSVVVTLTSTTLAVVQFEFASPLTVTPGSVYSILVVPDVNGMELGLATTKAYSAGDCFGFTTSSVNWLSAPSSSFYFETFGSAFSTNRTYTDEDPSAILQDIMATYAASGGMVAADTFGSTGLTTSYTFKIGSVLAAISAIVGMGPSNWYWYVDPSTNTLHYEPANTIADVLMIKGRHFTSLEIEATKENIKTVVYFSGGDDGTGVGTTIFVKASNPYSTARPGLALLSDNRVTGLGGASIGQLIANNYLDTNNAETYITTIIIQDTTYDISQLKLGQMVGFAGFGTFVDQLLLQIVGIQYTPDAATLQLGTLPKRSSAVVEFIQQQLIDQQTALNPPTPAGS